MYVELLTGKEDTTTVDCSDSSDVCGGKEDIQIEKALISLLWVNVMTDTTTLQLVIT